MSVFKCKMCGGNLEVQEGMTVCECEYCGSIQTVPQLDDEKKIKLFTRANRLRSACEFDKASGVYESIVSEFPEEAEAYWGLVLCQYGIEYVDDPKTGKKIPTCHRSSFDSIMEDPNFEMVLEYSDSTSRAVYRNEAKAIERLRTAIIEVSSKEDPYDIFICYKETDPMGERTIDSVIAQDVYDALTEKGYKVFFSRITLEDKLGQEYEPYIFAALNSAKVMLAFGSDYEYFNAVWVKNEWSRFLSLIEKGAKKTLIPCFKGIDAYDMPKEFARLQAQDMGKVGAIQDLIRGIKKITEADKPKTTVVKETGISSGNANIVPLLKRAFMFLEDEDWNSANEYCEKVLDIDPENASAYLGKLLVEYRVCSKEELINHSCNGPIEKSKNYQKIMRFGDDLLKSELKKYIEKQQQQFKVRFQQTKENINKAQKLVSIGYEFVAGVNLDGTVLLTHSNDECDVSEWTDIVAISCGFCYAVGLKSDGTVLATGDNRYNQCNVSGWTDVLSISCGNSYTVGLKSDGTVLATGSNKYGQCDVSEWRDIVAISCGVRHTVGLKSDGKVLVTGSNSECDVSEWRDIVAISCGFCYAVGLKSDGTVLATGSNDDGECNVSEWTDVLAISCGNSHTVGLKSDGTVLATGSNKYGQCDVSEWRDIVAISCGVRHTVGLKSDGTVLATGYNKYGQCDVSEWRDIVAISCVEKNTVGLRSNGTVVVVGSNIFGQCNVDSWKLYNNINTIGEDRDAAIKEKARKEEERRAKKAAYEKYVSEINAQIEAEIVQAVNPIKAKYSALKQQILSEMNQVMTLNLQKKKELEENRRNLESRRASLGIFKGKEKAAITSQISDIDAQLGKIETDQMIRDRYQPRFAEINNQEETEIRKVSEEIKSNHTIITIDEFQA